MIGGENIAAIIRKVATPIDDYLYDDLNQKDGDNMQRFKILLPLVIMTAAFAGCGKVAKESLELASDINKKDSSLVSTAENAPSNIGRSKSSLNDGNQSELKAYLALKIPSSAIRAVNSHARSLQPFKLNPFIAKLEGETVVENKTKPAKITYSISKGCNWKADMGMTIFYEQQAEIIRMDAITSNVERLDNQVSYDRTFVKMARMTDPQTLDGEIFYEERTEELISKDGEGFIVEYKSSDLPTRQSSEHALFFIESEKHRLSLIEKGDYEFSYRQVSSSSETLYTDEITKIYPVGDNQLQTDLWEVHTDSYEVVDGENLVTTRYAEILTSNAVPVYIAFEFDGMKINGWLKEFTQLPIDLCATQ